MRLRKQLLLLAILLMALPSSSLLLFRSLELTWRAGAESALVELTQQLSRQISLQSASGGNDLLAPAWATAPLQLDGYADDWRAQETDSRMHQAPPADTASSPLRALLYRDALWILVSRPAQPDTESDLLIQLAGTQWVIPGRLEGREQQLLSSGTVANAYGRWQPGHQLTEIVIPRDSLTSGLSLCPLNPTEACWIGSRRQPANLPEWLWTLADNLATLTPSLSILQFVATDGRVLVHIDNDPERGAMTDTGVGRLLLGWLASSIAPDRPDRPDRQWRLRSDWQQTSLQVRAPVTMDNRLMGHLTLERRLSRLSAMADRGLLEVLWWNWSLVTTIVLVFLLWASWLSRRIRRLEAGMSRSLDPVHHYQLPYQPESGMDEIAQASRSFAALLNELRAYAAYKESFVAKLTHECRTPISIIRSSLSLAADADTDHERAEFIHRAESGCERLSRLIQALGEISRLEKLIHQYERHGFDAIPVLKSMAPHYQQLLQPAVLRFDLPDGQCWLDGSEDLLLQALDKLLDNARSFTPPGGLVICRLQARQDVWQLSVFNEGSSLPDNLKANAFLAYVGARMPDQSDEQELHLGLGLAVVRLVMDFHGGAADIRNRGNGVEVSLTFPKATTQDRSGI